MMLILKPYTRLRDNLTRTGLLLPHFWRFEIDMPAFLTEQAVTDQDAVKVKSVKGKNPMVQATVARPEDSAGL